MALSTTVTIYANRSWQGTGIYINTAQDHINVQQTDMNQKWVNNPITGAVDANGHIHSPMAQGTYALPGAPEGCLCARNDPTGRPYHIGAQGNADTRTLGELQLVINDDLGGTVGGGLSDNSGQIDFTITYPSTANLRRQRR